MRRTIITAIVVGVLATASAVAAQEIFSDGFEACGSGNWTSTSPAAVAIFDQSCFDTGAVFQ